jgi:hypothetical protein
MLVTATGLQVDVDHLKPSEIRAYDIAWSLHNLNLFRGHALIQWDALSHVGLSYMLYVQDMKGKIEAEFALALLLDSAPKAYLGDIDPADQCYRDLASAILARFQISEEPLGPIPWDMVARYNRQAVAIAFHALFPAVKTGPKLEYEVPRFPILVKAKPTDYISILKYAAINHDVADVPGLFEVSETMKPLVAEAVPLVSEVHQEGDVDIEVRDYSAIEKVTL